MIKAAVWFADEKGPPPPDLQRYLDWKNWGVLPEGGGARDQRAGELSRMFAAADTFEFWIARKQGRIKLAKMNRKQLSRLRTLKELAYG